MEPNDDLRGDPWVLAARYILWFCGVSYLLIGLGCIGIFAAMPLLAEPSDDFPPLFVWIPFALLSLGLTVGVALVNVAAAVGLGRGRRWAWIVTLILGATYAPSACLPFGAVLLYAMLNDRTRRRYLG
jgi:hypothetical protein